MVTHWASSLRAGWLFSAYDEDGDDGIRKIPDESVELQLLNALEDLLLARVSPKDSAAKTAYLIMSEEDIDQWWYSLWTMYFDAVEKLEDEKHSKALVDYVVELASLPDAVNEGPGTKTIEECGGKKVRIEAGQTVVFEGWGTLWRDLPQFSIYFTDTLQGPDGYIYSITDPPISPEAAQTMWKNVNTYVALLASNSDAQKIPAIAGMVTQCPRTMIMALEDEPETNTVGNVDLHGPAAAQWFRIAGDEIERLCSLGTERYACGKLWERNGGTEVCDNARLQFWRMRLAELGY